jgi:hypothetical protein
LKTSVIIEKLKSEFTRCDAELEYLPAKSRFVRALQQSARPATRMTIGRHCMRRQPHDLLRAVGLLPLIIQLGKYARQ